MQDEARAWAELAGSLVNGLKAHPCDGPTRRTSNDANGTKTGGRKRVRRMQVELPFFRYQVRELELKLKRIKMQNGSPVNNDKSERASRHLTHNLDQIVLKTDQNSLWNGIAERQLKERLRGEQQRQHLNETHVEMRNMAVELHKLLKKYDSRQQELEERMTVKQQRYWDFEADPADEIYADQLAIVARMRQNPSPAPSRALRFGLGLSTGRQVVHWDPEVKAGFKLKLEAGTILPFNLEVSVDAYWRFFGCGYGLSRHVLCASDLLTDTITRSFKVQTDFEGFTFKVGGKYSARKYVEADGSIMIVWVGSGEPKEICRTKFSGTQLHKRGFIKLRRVPRQGQESTSTIVEISFETIPVFHDSVIDKEQHTRTLLDTMNKSYIAMDKLFCHRMGALLVEGDWKATFGT